MKLLFTTAVAILLVHGAQSQIIGTNQPQPLLTSDGVFAAVDAVGTEFTLFFQENAARRADFTFELQLFLTTHVSTPVTVRLELPLQTHSPITSKEVIVNKGNVTEVNFPQNMMHMGSGKSNRGIHILANAPIVVYGVNPQRFSSEGFIAIPNHLLGTEYYAVGMPAEDQHSQLGLVAVEGGTTEVTVTLPDNTELKVQFEGRTYSANDVIVTTLSQYQTFQLQHRNRRRGVADGDLSGARIECTKRCAAFSGNSRTSVSGASRDLLVEQLPPVSTWGKEFAVPPTPERTDRPDILKIVCQQDGTTVLIDASPHLCGAGGSIQEQISTAAPHYVTATKPVMVATVVMSQSQERGAIQADPAMTLIIPEEQYAQTYTIATATWSGSAIDDQAYRNFLTVVIRRDRIDSVVIDGMNVNTAYPGTVWTDIPSTAVGGKPALVTTYFNVTSGTHTISTLNDDTQFMCIVYGAGDRESYAYMGGMRLQVINPACTQVLQTTYGDGIDNDCDARIDEELCDGQDDDDDGSIDEDCVVKNAVIPKGNVTSFVGQTVVLRWTVFATDFTGFKGLKLYKQQPTAAEVLVGQGQGALSLTQLFNDTGRYDIKVSEPVKKGELFVVEVDLTVTSANTVDSGDYRLEYTAQNGLFDGVDKLDIQQRNQYYEIIAKDLVSGSTQYARSTQPMPRNLYFQEGKNYSLTFHSIGGQHLDDLPYRQFFNDIEATGDFEVKGLKKNYVTGSVTGLQDVKTVYELVDQHWTAVAGFDKAILSVKNADMKVVDSALLHVESIVRPIIQCTFEMNRDNATGRIICDITDVKVDIDHIYWEFDGGAQIVSPSVSGPYSTSHSTPGGIAEARIAVFDGIAANQWPDNTGTRTFQITFNQTNGYTLSAETRVTLSQLPSTHKPAEILCAYQVSGDNSIPASISCTDSGGNSAISSVSWLANTNGDNTLVKGGETNGVYTSSALTENSISPYQYSATLTINRPIIGQESYVVVFLRNGQQEVATIVVEGISSQPGTVEGLLYTDSETGDASIPAEVVGGLPKPNKFIWTVQKNDGTFSSYPAGRRGASGVTTNDNGNPSTTLNISGITSTRTFTLNSSSVVDGEVLWWASKSWTIQPRTIVPEIVPGVITGSIDYDNQRLVATVTGGSPAANVFGWTLPDGTVLLPGGTSGSYVASPANNHGNGSSTFYLNLGPEVFNAITVTFEASADSSWSGFSTYTLTARSKSPPVVACGLRSNNIRLGDEVEIVCTVDPSRGSGVPHAIDYLVYTNKLSGGNTRDISVNTTQPGFRYVQTRNSDGTIDSSLFFTLPSDFSDVKDYNFTAYYPEGTIVVQISLDKLFTGISTRPDKKRVVGVESGIVALTCNVQASGSLSFDDLMWKRRSLGESQLVQTVFEDQEIQPPFRSSRRFVQTNMITSDNFLTSTLKISNLQRGDVAEYFCVWSNNVNGEFVLDVIGSSMLVNNLQFNGHLTPFYDDETYTLRFEFESVDITDYTVKYGGIPAEGLVTERNGTRYDSFAKENVPVKVYTVEDNSFSPANVFVIRTFYKDNKSENPDRERTITDYVLTKKPRSTGQSDSANFVHIKVQNAVYDTDQTISVISGLPVMLSVAIDAPSCAESFRIIVGSVDLTSTFVRTTEVNGTRCIITYTKVNYIGNSHNGQTIQTVHVTPRGNTILSENTVNVINPPSTSTLPPLNDKTGSCSDRNGGCHHRCVTDSPTSFHCECDAGFTLADNERICIDDDECSVSNGGCDYICKNTQGSFTCACPPGLRLSANGNSCIDDDECAGNPCLSTEKCVNTFGSYHCISACECNCCDGPTQPNQGRKKRSADSKEDTADDRRVEKIGTFQPLNGIATLAWLLALTLLAVITLCLAIRSYRVSRYQAEANKSGEMK